MLHDASCRVPHVYLEHIRYRAVPSASITHHHVWPVVLHTEPSCSVECFLYEPGMWASAQLAAKCVSLPSALTNCTNDDIEPGESTGFVASP